MEGIQIFDREPKSSLKDKVEKAVAEYERVRHSKPEVCMIPHAMRAGLSDAFLKALGTELGITIKPASYCLAGWLWVGIDNPEPAISKNLEPEA